MIRKNSIMIKLLPEEKELIKEAAATITLNPATLGRMLLIEKSRELITKNKEAIK